VTPVPRTAEPGARLPGFSALGRTHYIADHRGGTDLARLLALVGIVLEAGVTCVQVRSKDCSDLQRYEVASGVVGLCRKKGAMCIVNDRVDIALAVRADGVHVGLDDLPVAAARELLGPKAVLGASAYALEEAVAAVAAGATYVGVGPCYPTSTKDGLPAPLGPRGLAGVARGVSVPVIAIGGVTAERVPELVKAGAYGVAVISAISGAGDPAAAARQLVAQMASAVARVGAQP